MLTLNQAADECGRAKSTISKAIANGKMSAIKNEDGSFSIEPSELFRVFPKKAEQQKKNSDVSTKKLLQRVNENTPELAIDLAKLEIENKFLREQAEQAERTKLAAEKQLNEAKETFIREMEEARKERDEWREQAKKQTLLLENRDADYKEATRKKRFSLFGKH